ncbi:MAG TPA: ATP-binding protein [Pararobbsia sp.]|nr:ATP-binding protein [Pararobbsia sp.]
MTVIIGAIRVIGVAAAFLALTGAPAQAAESASDNLALRNAEFVASDSPTPPATGWAPVTLPDNWVDSHPGLGGFAWYRVHFHLDAVPDTPLALYVPHISLVGSFFLNGSLLNGDVSYDKPHGRMGSAMNDKPFYLELPSGLFHAGDNTLYVRLQGHAQMRSGLSAIQIGPVPVLKARQNPRYFFQVVLPNAVFVIVFGALIFLAAHLWHRRSAHLFQLAAVLSIGNLGAYLTLSFPVSRETEVFVRLLAHLMLLWAFVVAGYRLADRRDKWFLPFWHALSIATAIAAVVFYAIGIVGDPMWELAWPHTLVRFIVLYWMFVHAWRIRSLKLGAIALSATFWNLSQVQSAFIVMNWLPWDTMRTSTVGVVPFTLVLLFVFAEQFILDRDEAASAQRDAITAERSRILQEMHDGMGAHLIAALHLARREDIERLALVRSIEDSIQDMRSIIDSLDFTGRDLIPLLANLRSRLEPRLKALGIELKWGVVAPLPEIVHMTPEKALAAMRIVQESVNNAIQHAQARTIRIAAVADNDAIRIEIADDGRGFDPDRVRAGARGLTGMLTRARTLHADVDIVNDRGTTIVLRIPCVLELSPSGR